MTDLRKTSVDDWLEAKAGSADRDHVAAYQLARLQETIAHARKNSPFYRARLAGMPDKFPPTLGRLEHLPFTDETDLREHHQDMAAAPVGDIARIVTLRTSGTTDLPKRVYFTEEDLDLTEDFFHHGMKTLTDSGGRVMVFMPGPAHGSIGDLLMRGLTRMDAHTLVYGPVADPDHAVRALLDFQPDSIVGIPSQVFGLTRHPAAEAIPRGLLKTVLLSADHAPAPIIRGIGEAWGCEVYDHYGMTEMGYGGGVECDARQGYHLREADLIFEIIDPETGHPVPEGDPGEVVFTTLNRTAMPLIRYRTGDKARFLTGPCPCGGKSRRLGKVGGRFEGDARLDDGSLISITLLDEEVFQVSGLLNYRPVLETAGPGAVLRTEVFTGSGPNEEVARGVRQALMNIDMVRQAVQAGSLRIGPVDFSPTDWPTAGAIKRKLVIEGEAPS